MGLVTELDNIARSIGKKTGQPAETYRIGNMAEAIDSIVTDFPSVPEPKSEKLVIFYDYDGTILTQMTVEEAQKLTALPELPKHEGMIAQCWTHSLEEVTSCDHDLDVGIYWVADDPRAINEGATVMYFSPASGFKNYVFKFQQSVSNGIKIDWGDGSPEETVEGTGTVLVNHTFDSKKGTELPYKLVFTPVEGCVFTLGHASSSHPFCRQTERSGLSVSNSNMLEYMGTIILGKCVLSSYCFYQNCGPRYILLNETGVGAPGSSGVNLITPHFVFPKNIDLSQFSVNCSNMLSVVIPNGISQEITKGTVLNSASKLKRLIIPDCLTKISSYVASSCASLETVYIPKHLTSLPQDFLTGLSAIRELDLPDNLTSMGDNCLGGYLVETFTYPSGVTSVNNVFCGTSGSIYNNRVKEFILPPAFTSFGYYTFSKSPYLEKIVFTADPTQNGIRYFFSNSYSTGSVTVPMVKIDMTCFTRVPEVTNVTFSNLNFDPTHTFLVPADLYEDFISAPFWSEFADQIVAVEKEN